MADAVAHIGENSPEYVAYQLLKDVSRAEGKLVGGLNPNPGVTRQYILDTYAECLVAVRHPNTRIPD